MELNFLLYLDRKKNNIYTFYMKIYLVFYVREYKIYKHYFGIPKYIVGDLKFIRPILYT